LAITDYLIIGAGAMGIAFADELFTRNPTVKLIIVDKRSRFGGHWVDAYNFVQLHQPAAFYGVNSLVLGNGSVDLSSKQELLDYYDKIHQKFQASGRVTFLGEHEYMGNQQVRSVKEPDKIIEFEVRKKVVDATYMKVEIPATHPPKFAVEAGVPLVPLNDLVSEYTAWDQFYVIGNGKTGMDAVLFLLNKGIEADKIYWIAPNDAWFFNRSHMQAGKVTNELIEHAKLIKDAPKADDVFLGMEAKGGILRLDQSILPTKWRCATVSLQELEQLRKIKNIIRKGRINRITPSIIELQKEKISYGEKTLFVNCTADGLAKREAKAIFSKKLITLQSVLFCQQVFSAAAIARLELSDWSDKVKNRLKPVPHPEFKDDWPLLFLTTLENILLFNSLIPLWMYKSRLNFMSYEAPHRYLYYAVKAIALFIPIKNKIGRSK
jgi:hypothetical protein